MPRSPLFLLPLVLGACAATDLDRESDDSDTAIMDTDTDTDTDTDVVVAYMGLWARPTAAFLAVSAALLEEPAPFEARAPSNGCQKWTSRESGFSSAAYADGAARFEVDGVEVIADWRRDPGYWDGSFTGPLAAGAPISIVELPTSSGVLVGAEPFVNPAELAFEGPADEALPAWEALDFTWEDEPEGIDEIRLTVGFFYDDGSYPQYVCDVEVEQHRVTFDPALLDGVDVEGAQVRVVSLMALGRSTLALEGDAGLVEVELARELWSVRER